MYKKISFVGLGKLGLPLATNFAKNGHEVLAIDKNTRLIEILNAGKEPWLEVGLLDNIKQAKKNITYTTGYDGVGKSDVSIILVNTPSIKKDGSFSNLYVEQSIQSICEQLELEGKKEHHIILSSTVMPGSINNDFIPLIKSLTKCKVSFSYVPDFVAIGQVIKDFKTIQASINLTNIVKKSFLNVLKDYRIRDSHANFVLLEHTRAKEIIEELKSSGILVRDRSKFINNTMRITIGDGSIMKKIAEIIKKY